MKKFLLILASLLVSTSIFASSGGSSSKPLEGSYPIILSHGLFGWGDGSGGIVGIINYWGGMDDSLREQGASVYAPTKTAANSNEYRAQELKDSIQYYMASTGASKVHIIGHSQGGLDSRYMIANLGMSGKVSTLATLASPHYGSPIADLVNAVIPDWLEPFANKVIGTLVKILGGGTNQGALAAMNCLTTDGMATFNSVTPNASGVKYYSYGSYITITDIIQHPLMGILHPINGLGGSLNGQGFANDGLVPYTSSKWGTWKGRPSHKWYATGIDHLQISNTLRSGELYFDVEGFFLDVAKNQKNNQ